MQLNLHHAPGVIAAVILWQTRGRWSHASCTLRDGRVIESREFVGVRTLLELQPGKGEHIDIYDVPMTDAQETAMEKFLQNQLGKGYDYLSILRFITRKPVPHWDKKRWFCSELQFEAFKLSGVSLLDRIEAWAVSPELLGISPLPTYRQTIYG
jgi:uncharacterized protein YycO